MKHPTFEEVVSVAIQKEAGAASFYEGASKVAEKPHAKVMFEEMAAEERRHRKMLEGLTPEKISKYKLKQVPDLKISEYVQDTSFSAQADYQDILIIAMKREEESHRLYTQMGEGSEDPTVQKLFRVLAQEEAKHKLRLEKEYDDYVLTEN